MEAWVIILLLGLGTPVAGLAAAAAIRWRLRRSIARRVRATPLRDAGDISADLSQVAVQGVARATATLEAPIAGIPVIGYRLTIEFTDPGGREQSGQRHAIDTSVIVEFDVEDGTGSVRVRGTPAVLAAVGRKMDPGDVAVALTGGVLQQLIHEEGHSANDLVAARNLWATERLLLPDSAVYVCGHPKAEVVPLGGGAGYRQPPTRVVLQADPKRPLVVADCHRQELLLAMKDRLG